MQIITDKFVELKYNKLVNFAIGNYLVFASIRKLILADHLDLS